MSALTDRLLVSFDGETPHETTVRSFCSDNAGDRSLCRRARALSRGEHFVAGGGAAPRVAVVHLPANATKRERQYKHVLASSLASGKPEKVAVRIAAATVNKYRAEHAGDDGPRLVTEGGSRRQWFPGKKRRARR